MRIVDNLQSLGRALMLPIAVLPVAGLLLRLGQPDIAGSVARLIHGLDLSFLGAAGGAIFDNLGLLFAIGAAVGLARDNHGAAGLAGAVCFVVATSGARALLHAPVARQAGLDPHLADLLAAEFREQSIHDLSVPIGVVSGVLAGLGYNRFGDIRLPDYLAFFGGRRFVPIALGLAGAVIALAVAAAYQGLHEGLIGLSRGVVGAGDWGLFLYGALNRLLIITGLHHILNNVAWFLVGDFHGATGDLRRFFAGDPTAGAFMAGFFPVMMFGLPAACLAMYHAATRDRRAEVGGMLASMALTSFLTGVTEPVEFTFMFLAPALFVAHMALTGLAFVIMEHLGVKLGFSFSAGLFDYLINFRISTRPWLLLPVGAVYFGLYYGVFRAAISLFDLKTPGREAIATEATTVAAGPAAGRAEAFLAALGGPDNLESLDACTTRLRLTVRSQAVVDEAALRRLGAKALVRPSERALQVILGPLADIIAGEIRAAAARGGSAAREGGGQAVDVAALVDALGGADNLAGARAMSTRLLVTLRRPAPELDRLARLAGVRSTAGADGLSPHLIVGAWADSLAGALAARAGV